MNANTPDDAVVFEAKSFGVVLKNPGDIRVFFGVNEKKLFAFDLSLSDSYALLCQLEKAQLAYNRGEGR